MEYDDSYTALSAAFEHLSQLQRRHQDLVTLEALNVSYPNNPDLKIASRSLGLSVEANVGKQVSKALTAVKDAIIKAWQYLVRLIKKFTSNYRVRTERIQDEITGIEQTIKTGEREGWLSGQRSGHLDNPHIARALIKGNRTSFSGVDHGLGLVANLADQAETLVKTRLKTNQALFKTAQDLPPTSLKARFITTDLRLQWQPAPETITRQLNLRPYNTVSVSEGLCGNTSIVKIDYAPGTKLSDQLSEAPSFEASPWLNSPYGYRLVMTNPKLDLYAMGAAYMPILSVQQLKNLTAKARNQISALKLTSNVFDDAEDALEGLARQLSRLDLDGINPITQKALRAYLSDGTRNDLNLGIDLGKYLITLVFQTLQWIKASINAYRG